MIFPSTLIIGRDRKTISDYLSEITNKLDNPISTNNPDILHINENSGWGIDVVRKISSFFSQKPYNHLNKIVIITDADNLKTEAQNSLLKILEEPGPENYLILTSPKSSSLLDTVVSRCHVIKIKANALLDLSTPLLQISGLSVEKKLEFSESIAKDKDSVLPYLENQLELYQLELLKSPNKEVVLTINKVIKAIEMIKANVDPKSALDYLLLS